jgi:type I restriction enzyme R subunit
MGAVERILDESIDAAGYAIQEPTATPYGGRIHLGTIDFDALARFFAKTKQKAATAETMAVAVQRRVEAVVRLNPTRTSLREQLERLIANYNEGAHSTEEFFQELLTFTKKLEAEEGRAEGEGLNQEQLAFYDLVLAPGVTLSTRNREVTKKIARDLPRKIVKKLVIDWRKSQRARAAVKAAIKDALDALPEAYGPEQYEKLVETVYEHVFESYWGEGRSKYVQGEPT